MKRNKNYSDASLLSQSSPLLIRTSYRCHPHHHRQCTRYHCHSHHDHHHTRYFKLPSPSLSPLPHTTLKYLLSLSLQFLTSPNHTHNTLFPSLRSAARTRTWRCSRAVSQCQVKRVMRHISKSYCCYVIVFCLFIYCLLFFHCFLIVYLLFLYYSLLISHLLPSHCLLSLSQSDSPPSSRTSSLPPTPLSRARPTKDSPHSQWR